MNDASRTDVLGKAGQDLLFFDARTHNGWRDLPVSDALLMQIYDLAKWGPTSFNCSPLRVVFVRSAEAKEKLRRCLVPANVDKTMTAPACAILAYDLRFHDHLARMFPASDVKGLFENNEKLAHDTAFRNGSLQGAYFILAARALGLDCAPMSGFDNGKVDQAFFAGTAIRSNFLCALGYGDPAKLYPRGPRFGAGEVCSIA